MDWQALGTVFRLYAFALVLAGIAVGVVLSWLLG